ncbi:MAG: hypothetical protein EOO09_15270 [Chitinophagaceae bacterium]|nr:MAG: hypothetical protein EOO09_15270 [Chitinophagaceae bacterium]
MKHILLACCAAVITCCLSCSKDKGDAPEDRTESFRNSVWAGEFQYATGSYTSVQPFSVSLASDGTLTWSDIGSTRPGGTWAVDHDTITITFPNSTSISATVTDDSWSEFKGGAAAGVFLTQVSRAAAPDPAALPGSTWIGTLGGSPLFMNFIAGQKMNFTLGETSLATTLDYSIEGAGIRFTSNGITSTSVYYALLVNKTTMKGVNRFVSGFPSTVNYFPFTTNKQ